MHSCILAAIVETPFVALSYSDKISDLGQEMGLGDYFFSFQQIDNVTLNFAVHELLANESDVKARLRLACREQKEKLATARARMASFLIGV